MRRAGGNDYPVEFLVLDGLLDRGLTRLSARVHDVLGVDHILEAERAPSHFGHVHGGRDVASAVADKDADSHGLASSSEP